MRDSRRPRLSLPRARSLRSTKFSVPRTQGPRPASGSLRRAGPGGMAGRGLTMAAGVWTNRDPQTKAPARRKLSRLPATVGRSRAKYRRSSRDYANATSRGNNRSPQQRALSRVKGCHVGLACSHASFTHLISPTPRNAFHRGTDVYVAGLPRRFVHFYSAENSTWPRCSQHRSLQ